ncbi:DUF523 domain-containing protein [Actinomadura craniellae]|uniref:DUF523 domain-containing protein n=1 Tax=Actinomadura craniellae TaxID=2231787 RepID=A0A365GUZ0_9ACTN|nr:DUF523 domain-containing protein [Actinomadura craniellae]RAY10615.1 DUF523 domain-containing protein [Actinomadura craniellae]
MEPVLVSACLLGRPVRYDGRGKPSDSAILARWRAEGRLVPVCPELAGGLAVPRSAAELTGPAAEVLDGAARVRTVTGDDVTEAFTEGAQLALAAALRSGARLAVLKEGSPSCATERVYDGAFSGVMIDGAGVTTELLRRHGVQVFNETQFDLAAEYLHRLESPSSE